jgi:inhibitor of cysteine peptidase
MTRSVRLLTVLITASLAVAVLSACAARPAGPVELAQKQSGSTQSLAAGQELSITLDANPTTGYQWALDGALPPQLKQVGEPKYSGGSGAIGAGGSEEWTFSGATPGEARLRLKYWRSFESSVPPVQTFDITVNVK